ncbi:RIP homotypic interaction motif-containing protein [Xanthomonas sp. SI]|uniref:RIP homotypic interaction motif-containing protein n=1 Tax=Xanthomonas sp. SI TaxID=2724123 RepID=UPI00185FED2B|nr:RIP homotypic interaction motif-containing protein [Xanthomonas sp. SI]QNH14824.1 hypothetical protein HEP75_04297 [Xanthomonas sp. SI]
MSFADMTKDKVFIVKPSGERLGPYNSALSPSSCTIFDKTLDVDHGDTIARPLPNGKEEHYTVLRADFREDFHGIPGGYDLKLQKEQQIHKAPSSVVNNVSITHSTGVQVGDHNIQNMQTAFKTLERAIDAQTAPPESKADAKTKLQALLQHPLVVAVLGGAASGVAG